MIYTCNMYQVNLGMNNNQISVRPKRKKGIIKYKDYSRHAFKNFHSRGHPFENWLTIISSFLPQSNAKCRTTSDQILII